MIGPAAIRFDLRPHTSRNISGKLWKAVHTVKKKPLIVDREQLERIAKNLLQSKPLKREDVKVSKRKPEKLSPPQK